MSCPVVTEIVSNFPHSIEVSLTNSDGAIILLECDTLWRTHDAKYITSTELGATIC